jgi:hypothetical protein
MYLPHIRTISQSDLIVNLKCNSAMERHAPLRQGVERLHDEIFAIHKQLGVIPTNIIDEIALQIWSRAYRLYAEPVL